MNADRLDVGVRKAQNKRYWRHSGYPGAIRSETLEALLARDATQVVRKAVRGMLPHGPLGRKMGRRLHVYRDQPSARRPAAPAPSRDLDSAVVTRHPQGTACPSR